MKILMASHLFAPSVGGIETMSLALAHEFVRQGHALKVVTQSPAAQSEAEPEGRREAQGVAEAERGEFSFEVVRRPRPRRLYRLVGWCDIYFHNNIGLQTAWPLLLRRRPWVVAHQTYIERTDGGLGWQDRLKRLLLRAAYNVSISQPVAQKLPVPSAIIGNCYRDDLFRCVEGVQRERDLVFLGRLVSDKGVDTLLHAMALLKRQGVQPSLTIIGSGPDEEALKNTALQQDVASQVGFVGAKSGEALVRLLNAHRILVIPSRWAEPFGIVALEGIACGCVAVGSRGGGLGEAIGPCGVTFPNGDASALAQALRGLLDSPAALQNHRAQSQAHLEKYRPEAIARAYLQLFESVISKA